MKRGMFNKPKTKEHSIYTCQTITVFMKEQKNEFSSDYW